MSTEDEDIRSMKSTVPRWLKVAAAWAGAIGAIVALLSQIGPPIHRWAVGNDIAVLQEQVNSCQAKVDALEKVAAAAIDASEDRFVENEKHGIQLRGALENLRNEVRVRHGISDVPPPPPPPPTFGEPEPEPERPRNRRARAAAFADETDERLSSARTQAPRQESLMEKIRRKAPSGADMLKGSLD